MHLNRGSRLARKTCPAVGCQMKINPKVLSSIGFTPEQASRIKPVIGKGCETCASGGSDVGVDIKEEWEFMKS